MNNFKITLPDLEGKYRGTSIFAESDIATHTFVLWVRDSSFPSIRAFHEGAVEPPSPMSGDHETHSTARAINLLIKVLVLLPTQGIVGRLEQAFNTRETAFTSYEEFHKFFFTVIDPTAKILDYPLDTLREIQKALLISSL